MGGFFGHPDAELITRWYQIGAFQPFFRSHAHIDSPRREPWLYGDPYTSIIRSAIRLRYGLLPYWYTLFWNSNISGIPPMRPIWMEFPEEESYYAEDRQFMAGPALLVSPVVESMATTINLSLPIGAKVILRAMKR